MTRLDELRQAEEHAEREILMAARLWRSYQRDGDKKSARPWLKKLAEAEESRRAASDAWLAEYARERAEELARDEALLAFESEGGRVDASRERMDQWMADFQNQRSTQRSLQ